MVSIDRLTDREKQCLRLLYAHHKPGQIATELDISTDRVNQLLKAARQKLGVTRSIDAAKLFAMTEATPSHIVGAPNVGLSQPAPASDARPSPGEETVRQAMAMLAEAHASFDEEVSSASPSPLWPIPTPDRPFNGLTWYQKLAWGIAIALGATVLAGAMISLQNAIH